MTTDRVALVGAGTLAALAVALTVATRVLDETTLGLGDIFQVQGVAFVVAGGITLPLAGMLVALRLPGHPVSWFILALAVLAGLVAFSDQYAYQALSRGPRGLPGGMWAGWTRSWVSDLALGWFATFPLVFPSGRLPSPHWRPVVLAITAATITLAGSSAFAAGIMREGAHYGLVNPAGVRSVTGFLEVVREPLKYLLIGVALTALGSLALRLKRSEGDERQQLKWMCLALAVVIVSFILFQVGPDRPETGLLLLLSLNLVAAAVTVAILKYRLYEIDYVINRALLYSALSAILAGVYAASIQLSRLLFEGASGIQTQAGLVGGTLVFGAAYFPAKNKLQVLIDRSFGAPPAKGLVVYNERLRSVLEVLDERDNARQFLDHSVETLGAISGALYLVENGAHKLIATQGDDPSAEAVRLPLLDGGMELGYLVLGPRRERSEYGEADIRTLQSSADLVARAIALSRQRKATAVTVRDAAGNVASRRRRRLTRGSVGQDERLRRR